MKCEACGAQASQVYTGNGPPMNLCAPCLDQYQIQRAYNQRMMEIVSLANSGCCDEALHILQDLLEAHADRDHSGKFQYGIISHQALIFEQQERFAEALEKLCSIVTFPNQSERLVSHLATARVLDRMERSVEAIAELERGLDAAVGAAVPTALSLLAAYARIAERDHCEVPTKFKGLVEEVIRWWGIHLSNSLREGPSSLSRTILAADMQRREAAGRYDRLQKELDGLDRGNAETNARQKALRAYIDCEPVGFYRGAAATILQQLELKDSGGDPATERR